MKEGAALAVSVACVVVALRHNPFNWGRSSKTRPRKRVSFSEADNTVIQHRAEDLTEAERRELCWTPAELREFARSTRIDDWIQDWGS